MNSKNKKGFTLAEVLITLSILGVVAAISIPNLIRSYEKTLTVTKLKMAYANLEKAAANIRISTGCMNQDITCAINAMGGESASEEDFAQKFIEYSGFSDMKKQPMVWVYKLSDKNTLWNFLKGAYISKNKIKYSPRYTVITTKNGMYAGKGIVVNVVTDTQKAVTGKNHFMFLIYDNFIVEPASLCYASVVCPMSLNATYYTCLNNSIGYSCLEKIIKDGWKITYW